MKSSSKRSLQSNAVTLHLSKNSSFNSGTQPQNKHITLPENGYEAPKLSPIKSNRGKQSAQTQQQQQQQLKSLANQIPRANLDLSSQQFQFSNQQFYGEMQVATSSQSIGSQVSNGSQKSSSSSQVSSSRICSSKSRSSSQKAAHHLDNGLGGTHINSSYLNGEQLFMKLCNNNNSNNQSGVLQNKSCLPSPPKIALNTLNNHNNNTSFSVNQIPSNSSLVSSEKFIFQGMTTPTSPSAQAENEPLPQIQKSFSNSTEHYHQKVGLDLLNKCILVSNYKEASRVFQASNFTIHEISNYRDKTSNNLLIHSLAMRADSVVFLKFLESSLPGIDLNLFSSHGWTPLMLACMKGNYEVSHYLASHKRVDVNAQDLSGNSALHIACMYGHRKIVEMLLGQRLVQSNLKNNEDKYPKDLTSDSKITLLFSKLRKVNLDQSQSCTSIAMDLTLNSSAIREQIYQESPRRASRSRNNNPLLSLTSSVIQQPLRSHSNSSYSSSHQTLPNGLSSTAKHLNKAITKNSFFNLKQSVNYSSSSHINSPSINSSFSSNKCSQANSPNVAYLSSSTTQTKAKQVLSTFSAASQSAQYRQIQKINDSMLKGTYTNNISQIQEYTCNGTEETSPNQQNTDNSISNNSNISNIMSSQVLLRAKSGIISTPLTTINNTIERGSTANYNQNQNCDQNDFINRQGQHPTESRQDKYSRYAIQNTTQAADNSILIMSKIGPANLTLNNRTLNESSSPLINTEPLENDSPLLSKGNICSPFKSPPISNSSWKGTNPNSNSISKILEKNSRSRSQNQNTSKHKALLTTPSQAQNKSPNKYKSQQGQTDNKIAAFNPQVYSNGGNISTAASSKLCSVDKANGANGNNTNKISSDSNESTDQTNHPSLALSAKTSPLIFSAGKVVTDKKSSTQFSQTFQSPLPLKSSQSMQVYSSQEINPFQSSGVSQLQKQKTLEIPFQKPQDYIITPISYVNEPPQKGIESYRILSHLGSGNYGDVFLVEHVGNNKKYAMKLLNKEKLVSKNMLKYAIAERNVMQKCNSPFIVKMIHSFQTDSYLVIVMEYCPGGDLYSCLLQKKRFDEEIARKYLSEILLAVEELHYHDVIYRDMKPENIVLGSDGHVKLIDFGLSRENIGEGAAQSFCGSAVYLAPEIISKKGHNKSVDWYQFGVLAYELLVGQPPFNQLDRKELYFHIQNKKVEYPSFLSDKAKSLITALLNKNPEERLGSGRAGAYQIKDHPFFDQTNWFDVKSKIHSMPVPQIQEKRKDTTKVDPKIYQTQLKDSINVPQWYFLNTLELF